ncbi:MAG: DUF438 domain-containing protein, partial [Coriobacteriia bacterium]|nr:DUF438 domain-containing protein [Coriobacteriia bacterium]
SISMNNKHLSDDAQAIQDMLKRMEEGESPEAVKDAFVETFKNKDISAISAAEQELLSKTNNGCGMSSLCDVHMLALSDEKSEIRMPELEYYPPHPLAYFKLNQESIMQLFRETIRPCIHGGLSPEELPQNLSAFQDAVLQHFSLKENVLFAYLDKAGVVGPSKLMWEADDEIRDLIQKGIDVAYSQSPVNVQGVVEHMHKAIGLLRSQFTKEEQVLIPLVGSEVSDRDLYEASKEMLKIGYSFDNPRAWEPENLASFEAQENLQVMHSSTSVSTQLNFNTGVLSPDEINGILNSIGDELSFVNAHDIFTYYSDLDVMHFPRTKANLNNTLENLHPLKSLPIMYEVRDKLKNKEVKTVSKLAHKGGKRFLVQYHGIFDESGRYLGILETVKNLDEFFALIKELEAQDTSK